MNKLRISYKRKIASRAATLGTIQKEKYLLLRV